MQHAFHNLSSRMVVYNQAYIAWFTSTRDVRATLRLGFLQTIETIQTIQALSGRQAQVIKQKGTLLTEKLIGTDRDSNLIAIEDLETPAGKIGHVRFFGCWLHGSEEINLESEQIDFEQLKVAVQFCHGGSWGQKVASVHTAWLFSNLF